MGQKLEFRVGVGEWWVRSQGVCGGAKVRARGYGVFAEGSPRRSLRSPADD